MECAIASVLSLVSHEKSAHSTNQAELFDHILLQEQQVKHIAMYYERQFTKLEYSTASILTHYLEFLITELAVLACITHKITLPFLCFVEVSSQLQLQMFPHLFNDLKEGRMDTLKDCH